MKHLRFYKETGGSWYVDLPEWEGDKAELLMVAGADTLLDILAEGKNEVEIDVDLKQFSGATRLDLRTMGGSEGGGHYFVSKHLGRDLNFELWLCDVTRFIFEKIPQQIYFRVVNPVRADVRPGGQ